MVYYVTIRFLVQSLVIYMDSLQRFIFEHANIRGEIVHLNDTFLTITKQRPYPPMVRQLLGEALVSCLLLVGSIKFEGSLNLQFQGDKRLPLLVVQCDNELNIRAFAKFEPDLDIKDYADAFLTGQMALTINQDNQTQSYQSIVPLESTSMSENLMLYFAQSEQISTRVWLAVNDYQAAGMLLQLMPGEDTAHREEFWEYATQLGQTVTADELLNLENELLLHRLYHEKELRIFEPRITGFKCRCSIPRMQNVLKILGEEDVTALLKERGEIEIKCDFCNTQYRFDAIDITYLFTVH